MAKSVSELYGTQFAQQCPNGRILLSPSTESFLIRPGERNRQDQQKTMYENCKRLVAKNKRQQCVFYLMMVLCFLSTLVYIAVVAFLLSARSATDMDSNPGPSKNVARGHRSGGGQNEAPRYPYCMAQADIIAHEDLYRHNVSFEKSKSNICFTSLEWLPQLIQRVNSSIQNRASLADDRHQKISDDLVKINTSLSRSQRAMSSISPEDMSSSRLPVYAHLSLNNDANHSDTLKWNKAGIDQSSSSRMKVNRETGEVVVGESGSYFVYSHVTFKKRAPERSFIHQVVKNCRSGNAKEVLLATDRGPASNLQGVFRLMVNDTLSVIASPDQLNTDTGMFTYFGTYLMRT